MNVRYYQRLIRRYEAIDTSLRVTAALLASAGVITAVKAMESTNVAIAVGLVSAFVGVSAQVFGLPDRIRTAASILPRYVSHAHTLERLWADQSEDAEAINDAVDAMHQTEMVEAEKMRDPDDKLLALAQADVERQIGSAPVAAKQIVAAP